MIGKLVVRILLTLASYDWMVSLGNTFIILLIIFVANLTDVINEEKGKVLNGSSILFKTAVRYARPPNWLMLTEPG